MQKLEKGLKRKRYHWKKYFFFCKIALAFYLFYSWQIIIMGFKQKKKMSCAIKSHIPLLCYQKKNYVLVSILFNKLFIFFKNCKITFPPKRAAKTMVKSDEYNLQESKEDLQQNEKELTDFRIHKQAIHSHFYIFSLYFFQGLYN